MFLYAVYEADGFEPVRLFWVRRAHSIAGFITKRSVVLYAKADLLDVAAIDRVISDPRIKTNWRRHDCCSAELLERIRQGLIDSKYTKNKIKVLCKKLWGIR